MNMPPIIQQLIQIPNPRDMAMQRLRQLAPNNEQANNLLNKINNNDGQGVEQILTAMSSQYNLDVNAIRNMRR